MIAFPVAPDPPPPKNSTVGGPQRTAPTLQGLLKTSEKSKSKSKLSGSTDC